MSTTIYGIKNCDTIKKALKWLDNNNIEYRFHDYRVDGLDEQLLTQLCQFADPQQMLNKRSTSFRALSDEQKATLDNESLKVLFLETPTLIKRPLLVKDTESHLGFKPEQYQTFFKL
ncbi:ArsC family reductase [Alteromonadales bacterium alter-6D02]|nr:ArsC family reductase [Alteromonadales bacterium alter-6D02]